MFQINDTIQTIQNLKQDYPIGTSIGIEHTYNDLHDLEDELKNIGKLVQDRLNNSSTGGIKRKRTLKFESASLFGHFSVFTISLSFEKTNTNAKT